MRKIKYRKIKYRKLWGPDLDLLVEKIDLMTEGGWVLHTIIMDQHGQFHAVIQLGKNS